MLIVTPRIRWWPALLVLVAAAAAVGWVWLSDGGRDGQDRVLLTIPIAFATVLLLAIWLVFFSRLPWSRRRWAIGAVLAIVAITAATTRIRGVTGDLVPILEWRWSSRLPPPLPEQPLRETPRSNPDVPNPAPKPPVPESPSSIAPAAAAPIDAPASIRGAGDYPQFLGADRNGTVTGIRLADDWNAKPPRLLWRRPIGAGWSGFAVAGGVAVTQEQRGSREMVVAYDLATGVPKWSLGDEAHYESTVAGEGPRATPTISRGRVFTLGSTGLLNCLDLETGRDLAAGHRRRQSVAAARFRQEQLAARRRRSDRRERWRPGRSFSRRLFSRVRRTCLAGRRRPRRATVLRCSRRSAAFDRSSSSISRASLDTIRRRAACSGTIPGRARCQASRPRSFSRTHAFCSRWGTGSAAGFWRFRGTGRGDAVARVGKHAPEGQVH